MLSVYFSTGVPSNLDPDEWETLIARIRITGNQGAQGEFAPSLMFRFRARRIIDQGHSRTSIYRVGGCPGPDAIGQPMIAAGESVEGTICVAILSRDAHRVVMHLYNAHHSGSASDAHPGWQLSY
ncbi:MAG: hypothetical protein OXQ29_24360 [Rhodospirillaceae bacterium]|nr:hypothetical protein [Rhodospirillaceae bacterium]